jgi:hypothetical protein
MTKQARIVILFFVAGLAIGLAGREYYSRHHLAQSPPATTSPAVADDPTAANQNPVSPNLEYKVYFSRHTASDEDPARIYGYVRQAAKATTESTAVAQLIAGPRPEEAANGDFSKVTLSGPTSCTVDFRLTVKDQVATLQFCRAVAVTDTLGLSQAAAEINTTLEQFSNIEKVMTLDQTGQCLFGGTDAASCKRQP